VTPRERMLNRVEEDLVGPMLGPEEVLSDRPSDVYITGILWPQTCAVFEDWEHDDTQEADSGVEGEGSGTGTQIGMRDQHKPHSMGFSFRTKETDRVEIEISGARYHLTDSRGDDSEEAHVGAAIPRQFERWTRREFSVNQTIFLAEGHQSIDAGEQIHLHCWTRASHGQEGVTEVTLVATNRLEAVEGAETDRILSEGATVFQASMTAILEQGAFMPRPLASEAFDEDGAINRLIYRRRRSYATGHTSSASWSPLEEPKEIRVSWLPSVLVPSVDPNGSAVFGEVAEQIGKETADLLSAGNLSKCSPEELRKSLGLISETYKKWLGTMEEKDEIISLDEGMEAVLQENISRANEILSRINRGIDVVCDDPEMHRAFLLSMRSMSMQRSWGSEGSDLVWRPFQLAFQLMSIPSFCNPSSDNEIDSVSREAMDLLWFPTGGGKTEAYLGLISFVLFLNRIRGNTVLGRRTLVLMRYTLRTLTSQQFERASRLVMSMNEVSSNESWDRFEIGLWVGMSGSPNSVESSREENNEKAEVLTECPACSENLDWDPAWSSVDPRPPPDADYPWFVKCGNDHCPHSGDTLPIHVIDETLYEAVPDIVIGTIDKFAQITRKADTNPIVTGLELIIQDELHLVSGPLGSIDGIYEAGLDIISSSEGRRPKVIGSTATIRQAGDQVMGLYDRPLSLFPPQVRDWDDSCFARIDEDIPGRLYVGLTSCGKSPKFTQQALYASLIQGKQDLTGQFSTKELDPFHTILAYFNSRREVGGALTLVQDDTIRSIYQISEKRGTVPRGDLEIEEITARLSSEEIPEKISRLNRGYDSGDAVDIALSTNMISVGVDIPRLGLMVVNGQPKSMSEYIQATSRVGRNDVPGLVFTLYNDGKPRDRAHFEGHLSWLLAPYREVEANSVTPWSSRSRDKALRAVIVAIGRHRVSGMLQSPALGSDQQRDLEELSVELLNRVRRIDPDESRSTAREIQDFIEMWSARWIATAGRLQYWNEYNLATSLLMSWETKVTNDAIGGAQLPPEPAPNSMRSVEPEVRFTAIPALRTIVGGNDD